MSSTSSPARPASVTEPGSSLSPPSGSGARWVGAAVLVTAPAVMTAALCAHPYLARLPDAEAVASHVAADPDRWAVVHLLTNVGTALVAAAFVVLHGWLRAAGHARHSRWGLPLVVLGSVLYGFLPGLEFAPWGAVETGGDAVAVQTELRPWFVGTLAASAIAFLIGALAFARDVAVARPLPGALSLIVAAALTVLALARAVPLGAVQLYVQALAGVIALWPPALAYSRAWQRSNVQA